MEHIQTDIWVRRVCESYACADDTHGTATMLRAKELRRYTRDLIRLSMLNIEDLVSTNQSTITIQHTA